MMNELRDPHEPVIPGESVHPAEGHGGVSMGIGVSGEGADIHEPVMPQGMGVPQVQHVEDYVPQRMPLDEQLAEQPAPETCEDQKAEDAE